MYLSNVLPTWLFDVGSNALNQLIKKIFDEGMYSLSDLRSIMSIMFVLHSKHAFSGALEGVSLKIFSFAPLACLQPPFFCASVLNLL